jgi:hypothetical protein
MHQSQAAYAAWHCSGSWAICLVQSFAQLLTGQFISTARAHPWAQRSGNDVELAGVVVPGTCTPKGPGSATGANGPALATGAKGPGALVVVVPNGPGDALVAAKAPPGELLPVPEGAAGPPLQPGKNETTQQAIAATASLMRHLSLSPTNTTTAEAGNRKRACPRPACSYK